MNTTQNHEHDGGCRHAAAPPNPSLPKKSTPANGSRRVLRGFAVRLIGWWAGASGLFAMLNATCPFCGRPGCVAGAGASGLLGALVALAAADWKKLVRSLKRRGR
jgi:hypothetical protein